MEDKDRRIYFVLWFDPKKMEIGNKLIFSNLRGLALMDQVVRSITQENEHRVVLNIVDIT